MKYEVRENYINGIEINKMPYTNFYDNGKELVIKPDLTIDKNASFIFKNDVPDVNKIRFPRRLRNIYGIKNSVSLKYNGVSYKMDIKHSINDYSKFDVIPKNEFNISSSKIQDIELSDKLQFDFSGIEDICGCYLVKIFTRKKKYIKLEPAAFVENQRYFDNCSLHLEYGSELSFYPYEDVQYLVNIRDFRIDAAIFQRLKWSIFSSRLQLCKGQQGKDGRFSYYISEILDDFLTGKEIDTINDEYIVNYVTENTMNHRNKIRKTTDLMTLTKAMENDIEIMKKEHKKLLREQSKAIERLRNER